MVVLGSPPLVAQRWAAGALAAALIALGPGLVAVLHRGASKSKLWQTVQNANPSCARTAGAERDPCRYVHTAALRDRTGRSSTHASKNKRDKAGNFTLGCASVTQCCNSASIRDARSSSCRAPTSQARPPPLRQAASSTSSCELLARQQLLSMAFLPEDVRDEPHRGQLHINGSIEHGQPQRQCMPTRAVDRRCRILRWCSAWT